MSDTHCKHGVLRTPLGVCGIGGSECAKSATAQAPREWTVHSQENSGGQRLLVYGPTAIDPVPVIEKSAYLEEWKEVGRLSAQVDALKRELDVERAQSKFESDHRERYMRERDYHAKWASEFEKQRDEYMLAAGAEAEECNRLRVEVKELRDKLVKLSGDKVLTKHAKLFKKLKDNGD